MAEGYNHVRVEVCFEREHPVIRVVVPGIKLTKRAQPVHKWNPQWREHLLDVGVGIRGNLIRHELATDDLVGMFFLEEHQVSIETTPWKAAVGVSCEELVAGVLGRFMAVLKQITDRDKLPPPQYDFWQCVLSAPDQEPEHLETQEIGDGQLLLLVPRPNDGERPNQLLLLAS